MQTRIAVDPAGLQAEGARQVAGGTVAAQAGPWPSSKGFRAEHPLAFALPEPLGPAGTVQLWMRLDAPIANGPQVAEADGGEVLELPGLARLNLWWYTGYAGINIGLEGASPGVGGIEVPGLPGPQWLHIAFAWDAAQGRFQGTVNGTPIRVPGSAFQPWTAGSADKLVLHPVRWALADVQVTDRYLEPHQVLAGIPSVYRGALDHTLGAQALGGFDPVAVRGDALLELPLKDASDLAGWRMEGPGAVAFEDGWMQMRSTTPDAPGKKGHIVYWCDRLLPADFLLEFECKVLSEYGLNIVFFCARGRNGEDVFDPKLSERTGIFGHYTMGDIDCYHVSYFAQAAHAPGRVTSNLRKNHGFYLVDNGPIGIPGGSTAVHAVAVLKQGGRLRVAVDGRVVIDWFDDGAHYGPVLGAGMFALRQMKWTVAAYRNLRVSGVQSGSVPEHP